MFITLISTFCLERVLTFSTLTSDRTCADLRTVMLGETAFDTGFYDLIVTIAVIGIFTAALEYSLSVRSRRAAPKTHRWGLPIINILAGLGLLAICATPWAHFNVGHPLADHIYEVRSVIKPNMDYVTPDDFRQYSYDPDVWSCTSGPCQSDRDDTRSVYTHRSLGISFRHIAYYDCLTPAFNIAIKDAIGESVNSFDGDVRRFERIFFDPDGRYIGLYSSSVETPLMWSQLSQQERARSPMTFEQMIDALVLFESSKKRPLTRPTWAEWETLRSRLLTGDVVEIHNPNQLTFGLVLNDGTELIGTQPSIGLVDATVAECGPKCSEIRVFPRRAWSYSE